MEDICFLQERDEQSHKFARTAPNDAPTYVCRECGETHVIAPFDLPEADGSYTCAPCELAHYHWHLWANALEYPDETR